MASPRSATARSATLLGLLLAGGCLGQSLTDPGNDAALLERRRFPLDSLPTADVRIGPHTFHVWLALTPEQQQEGLMFVPPDRIPDDGGMLFVFDREQVLNFWMKNTVTPLDIAYARADGEIVTIRTMPPLTTRTFSSIEPAMFALEVKAGTFEKLGIREGDVLEVPDEVFKQQP